MTKLNRRDVLNSAATLATVAAVPLAAGAAPAAAVAAPLAPAAQLPFVPGSLGWLSEKLITSHHDNNYVGAVKRLGQIRNELAALDLAATPGYRLNGLKREELVAWNSMILHELYFSGLGQAAAPGAALSQAIERDFGSQAAWAAEFTAMGKALGGGSGWVVLTWSGRDRRLVNQWAADHSMAMAGSTPLLALDMYEHAYAMDFGAKAGDYVDGFMKSIAWGNADRLFKPLA